MGRLDARSTRLECPTCPIGRLQLAEDDEGVLQLSCPKCDHQVSAVEHARAAMEGPRPGLHPDGLARVAAEFRQPRSELDYLAGAFTPFERGDFVDGRW